MRASVLRFCAHLAAIAFTIANFPPHSYAQTPALPIASSSVLTYADEPIVIEHSDTVISMAADGTGWKQRTLAARVQTDAGVKRYSVLNIPYAGNSQHVEIGYARVTHADGTVVETPPAGAMDLPAAVTRSAPFYSDIKELQLPVRSLRVGDKLEFQYRIVTTKAEAPGKFWGQEIFSETAVALEQTLELRVPAGMYVQVWSPTIKPMESSAAAVGTGSTQHIYRWTAPQLKPTVGKEAESALAAQKKTLWTPEQELDAEQGKLPTVAWTTFKSWDEVGAWYRGLETDRVIPDEAVKAKVAELIKGKTTDVEKAQALYAYVATNIRYIGVAFGIGRYQPHAAAEILNNQYGDCKDKHTLLAAMLSVAGIQSDAVLIGARVRFNEEVPSPLWFNHLITRAAIDGKPVWLDSTAEVAPWAMLVAVTRDKQALVVPANGPAMIARTPADPPFPNAETVDSVGSLGADGVSTSRITITFRGDGELAARALFRAVPPDKYDTAAQLFAKAIGFQGTTSNLEVSRPTDTTQPFKMTFDYKREKAGDWAHLRTIPEVVPAMFPQVTEMEPPVRAIQLGAPKTETSTSAMKLPDGWSVILPPAVHAKSAYATYDMTYRFENGTVYANRTITVLSKKVPVNDWRAYKTLVDMVNPGKERYIQLLADSKAPEQQTRQIHVSLGSSGPGTKNLGLASEDRRNAAVASEYVSQLAGAGDAAATKLAAARAAVRADTAAAAAEVAAAAVELDASHATAAFAAGDKASVNNTRDKAASDYSALLAADDQLAKAATDLVAAAQGNAAFLAANQGNLAINDLGAQDSSVAANLLSAATKGDTAGYSLAAANEAAAKKDANTMAGLDPARANAFNAVVRAEEEAQSAATAAATGGSASVAATAAAAAAIAAATADGSGNPYAAAVERGAAAVANAASATISAQHAMDGLKMLK